MAPIMKDIGDTVGQSNEITGCSKTPTIPKAEKTAKSEIWVSTFLVLLFLFHNQALGADTRESLRQRILAGDQVSLRASAPEGARTIEASWIEEAVRRRVPIHISNAVIQGSLELQNSSVEQEFDLQECIFKDYADFSYAIFKRDFLVSEAAFTAGVSFQSAVFQQRAMFQRTRFEGGPINFADAHFFAEFSAEEASFGTKSATAVFVHARFDATADFAKSVFNIDVMFNSTQFLGTGFFPGARFRGPYADFSRAHFFDLAIFGGGPPADFNATFEGQAIFTGTQFDSSAVFNGVSFDGRSGFVGARFDGDADFETSVFRGPVSFRSAIFHAVYFSKTATGEMPQFGDDVDLLGCTYDRIEINWPSLLRYPNGQSRIHPYNRQPYVELEEVLRKAGFEEGADEVYAERRRVENGKGFRKLWDRLYWLTANYGIDLWHEFIGSLGFLLMGMWVLSRPSAVVNGESGSETTISWWSALCLAVRQFLPFSLPVKPRWTPSRHVLCRWQRWPLLTAATYANLLQIVGWILIPLAAAWFAGVLRHAAQ
jgi:uncharacterized protein YjbI with pentapeptide repeats